MHLKLNIMIDISGWQIIATKNFPRFCRTLREFIDFTEPERIFFGSDRPGLSAVMSSEDWVALIKDLPQKSVDGITFKEEEISLLLGGNAKNLLNL
jgi:predicted TIM-barrel fold metal-dependent hydrolase